MNAGDTSAAMALRAVMRSATALMALAHIRNAVTSVFL